MDRILYTAMSGAKQAMEVQSVVSHNLANVDTSGFRAQLAAMRAVPVQGDGHLATRVSVAATTPGVDWRPGPLNATGRDLDIAISDDGFLAIQDPDGNEAYTRRGDLQIDGNGILRSGGHPVIGERGPMIIPLGSEVFIGTEGVVSIIGEGQKADAIVEIGRLKLVSPGAETLQRGDDGLFRVAAVDGEAQILPADDEITVRTGVLEGSNVNPVESMVAMIDGARRYEMQMKVISSADENAQRANSLLSLS